MIVAVQINSVLMDPVYKRLKTRNGGVGKPEYRLRKFNGLPVCRRQFSISI